MSTPTDLRFLRPLQRVEVRWHTLDGGEVAIPGQVQSVDGAALAIWFDRTAPGFNPSHADDAVWLDVSGSDAVYVVPARLVGRQPPDILFLAVQGPARRDQRRHYVREVVDLPPVAGARLDQNGKPTGTTYLIRLIDLSGGGARFECSEQLQPDDLVELLLDLGDGRPFRAVVTALGPVDNPVGRCILRGYFSAIAERDRRRIIQYVFRQQIVKAKRVGGRA
jgi:c-di-GMP-binding flagellar brake protein YcgR